MSVRVTRAAQGGKGPRLTARLARGRSARRQRRPRRVAGTGAASFGRAGAEVDDGALAARLKPSLGDRVRVVAPGLRRRHRGAGAGAGATGCRTCPAAPGCIFIPRRRWWRSTSTRAARWPRGRARRPRIWRRTWRCCRRWRGRSGCATCPARSWWISPGCRRAGARRWRLACTPRWRRTRCGRGCSASPRSAWPKSSGARVHPPLHELLAGPHAAGLAALRRIAAEVASQPQRMPVLRASPAIVAALQADAEALPDLARRAGRALILRSDPTLPATGWTIEAKRWLRPRRLPTCPICGRPAADELRPFCSRRCADVDLGRWLTGQYRIPAARDDDGGGGAGRANLIGRMAWAMGSGPAPR